MSYHSDVYSTSSYRKFFGDSSRVSVPPVRSSAGHRVYGGGGGYRSRVSSGYSSLTQDADLAHTAATTTELKIVRTNEKEQLQGLNDRFAAFIERVRELEQHNRALEAEAEALRRSLGTEPARLRDLYERELRELRERADQLERDRSRAQLENAHLGEALAQVQEKLRDDSRLRDDAERELQHCRKEADDGALHQLELQKRVESLLHEIDFARKVHDEEVRELQASLQASQICVEMDVSKPDLTVALKDIRAQYEILSSQNQQQMEDWYRTKYAGVTEATARISDAIKLIRDELSDCRRQVQAQTLEMEALRNHNEALERQLAEVEDRHSTEIGEQQETIAQLEDALHSTKAEMSRHLREYQDLLNVKMALDIEIAAYRKLLEGEESRLGSVGVALIQPAYSTVSYTTGRAYMLGAYRRGGAKAKSEKEEDEKDEEEEGEEDEEEEAGEGEEGEEGEETGEGDEEEGGGEEEEEEKEEEGEEEAEEVVEEKEEEQEKKWEEKEKEKGGEDEEEGGDEGEDKDQNKEEEVIKEEELIKEEKEEKKEKKEPEEEKKKKKKEKEIIKEKKEKKSEDKGGEAKTESKAEGKAEKTESNKGDKSK